MADQEEVGDLAGCGCLIVFVGMFVFLAGSMALDFHLAKKLSYYGKLETVRLVNGWSSRRDVVISSGRFYEEVRVRIDMSNLTEPEKYLGSCVKITEIQGFGRSIELAPNKCE